MTRTLTFLVVFILSGIPATAVACDILLCADSAQSPQENCHEQALPQPGTRVTAGPDGCDHLVPSHPYVDSASRLLRQPVMSAAHADAPGRHASMPTVHAVSLAAHGPPRTPASSLLPLRI